MRYHNLGTTDIRASVIAFGTFPLGGWMWGGPTDENEAVRTLREAIDLGINLIDTAPMYGLGLAEELVGKAIRGRRDRVVVATKCGIPWDTVDWPEGRGELHCYADENGLTDEKKKYRFYRYLHPDSVVKEVEASLRRLGTDYIDLLQTHAQDETTPIEDTMGALEKLREQGKIRAIGCSNVRPDQLRRYVAAGRLDAVQEAYSLLNRQPEENGILDDCRRDGISFLAYAPLEQGLLTGALSPDTEYPEHDFRRGDPRFAKENVRKINDMLRRLEPVRRDRGWTASQLMLAWTASRYEKMHVLCGMRGAKRLAENAAAGDGLLTDGEMETIESIVRS